MKPNKSRIYCHDCSRRKILFDSQSKADNFIKFNGEEIEAESGHAPSRSYYCCSCNGWHVTSKKEYDDTLPSLTDKVLTAYRKRITGPVPNAKATLKNVDNKALLKDADDIMTTVKKLIKAEEYEESASLLQKTDHIFRSIPDTDDIVKYKQSLQLRYKKLLSKIDSKLLDKFVVTKSGIYNSDIESKLKDIDVQYDMGNYKVANELLLEVQHAVCEVGDAEYQMKLKQRFKIIETKINLKLGFETIEGMLDPDTTILLKECEDNFVKIELSRIYGDYHECVKLMQYAKRVYDVLLTTEGFDTKKKKIENRLHKYVELISQELNADHSFF